MTVSVLRDRQDHILYSHTAGNLSIRVTVKEGSNVLVVELKICFITSD